MFCSVCGYDLFVTDWVHKESQQYLFVTVRLQVGVLFCQTVVKAAVVALVQTLAARFADEGHQVHLKPNTDKRVTFTEGKACLTPSSPGMEGHMQTDV